MDKANAAMAAISFFCFCMACISWHLTIEKDKAPAYMMEGVVLMAIGVLAAFMVGRV